MKKNLIKNVNLNDKEIVGTTKIGVINKKREKGKESKTGRKFLDYIS